jgi:hypothetical protein
MSSLFRRLRERKLVQWGLACLAGAWLLLEAFGLTDHDGRLSGRGTP